MKLRDRTILITGGSSGIGLELASQLHRRGNTVLVTGQREAALEAARRALPGLETFRSDVSDPEAIARLHADVLAKHPGLDMLVNNAGVMRKIDLRSAGADLHAVAEEVDVNLSGPIRMATRFLPHLLTREDAAIVNVSSGLAWAPYPIAPVYGATKAALHSFTQSLRVQLKTTRVRVFELAPPAVDTPLNDVFAKDLEGTPLVRTDELVEEALRGLERDELEIRVGFAKVSRLLSRIAPGLLLRMLSKPVDRMLAEAKLLNRASS